jgi:hypothetical protein
MSRLFHVTSSLNRESIAIHGLDWTRMGATRGIAGSTRPEEAGVFLCGDLDVDFFVRMNNTGGPVDVWAVDGIDNARLVTTGSGFQYVPARIPAGQLALVEQSAYRPPVEMGSSGAYGSRLTITQDDDSATGP